MAQIRNYRRGIFETLTLIPIGQATGGNDFIKADGILTNAFSDLVLYTDAVGSSPVPNIDYSETTVDQNATTKEADTGAGGSGKTVYSQYQVTNATYQGIDLWATFTNFGTYTDNDASFTQQGGVISVSATTEITIPEGYHSVLVECDTTAGNITLTSSNAGFAGQRIRVKNSAGTGLVYCKLPGAYLGGAGTGTPISAGLMWRGDSDGTVIDPVNEVTADYVSGNYQIEQMPDGNLLQTRVYAFTTDGINSNYTNVSALPIALVDYTKAIFTSSGSSSFFGGSGTGGYMSFITFMTSSTSLTVGAKTASVPNSSTTTTATITVKEEY